MYKGVLPDATKIAVKRLTDYESPGGEAAFLREVELISVAVHRNLLRLIGFCTTQTERLLVYPFMQNLSVAYRLRGINFCACLCTPPTSLCSLLRHFTTITYRNFLYYFSSFYVQVELHRFLICIW